MCSVSACESAANRPLTLNRSTHVKISTIKWTDWQKTWQQKLSTRASKKKMPSAMTKSYERYKPMSHMFIL